MADTYGGSKFAEADYDESPSKHGSRESTRNDESRDVFGDEANHDVHYRVVDEAGGNN